MKFLCDEMLQRLGRWLRAAGYDTLIENNGREDLEILNQALAEGRYLITRDVELSQHRRAGDSVILLDCHNLEECVAELSQQLPINWLYQPFVRCMVCNTLLLAARNEQLEVLPQRLRDNLEMSVYCPSCQKVYWEGSHVTRMRRHLQQWQEKYCENATPDTQSPSAQ